MDALFLADSFVKSFGKKRVLTSASAWARPGQITVLLGRNGSGKSTLLKAALGLIPSEQGMVRFDGRHVPRPRLWSLASRGLSYLPDRDLLSRRLRFREQLNLVRAAFQGEDPREVVKELGVEGVLDSFPHEMSGGERRRAELALALARGPRCLLADEPLTEMAEKDRSLVMAVLQARARAGTAILLTGHEVRDLMDGSDEVIWVASGTTHGLGTPAEARAHHQFNQEYLGARGAGAGA